MTIEEKQQEIIEDFSLFEGIDDLKYEHIIEIGKNLSKYPDDKRTDDRIIEGCQSTVWLDSEFKDGKMIFIADSNSTITKGIIGLLIQVLNNESPSEIINCKLDFIEKIGFSEYFTSKRSNGLASMVIRMKKEAMKADLLKK